MAIYLIESKADQQKLIDYVGEDIAKLFFSMKDRLKSPENDIYYWLKRSPEELKNRLSELQSTKTRRERNDEASKGAELLYNKDGWKVYHITTYEASVKYGKNTQWCISGSKRWSNGEKGEHYFNDYTRRGIKFYFYIKSEDEKYALSMGTDGNYQVFNQVDNDVTNENLTLLPNVEGLPRFNFDDLLSEDGTYVYEGSKIPSKLKDKIKRVEVSKGVTEIGDGAFYNCTLLTSINIPDSVTEIGYNAFSDCCSLTSINIPSSVTEIGASAFESCTSLTSIDIPNSVTEIGEGAFYYCKSLTSIDIPNSVTKIDDNVFYNCYSLTSISIPDSVTYIGESAFEGCISLTSVNIPTNVTYIGHSAFRWCIPLKSISIPDSVTYIGYGVFYNCPSLTSISIPDSVTYIGHSAFAKDESLTIYTDNDYIIRYCEKRSISYEPLSEFPG